MLDSLLDRAVEYCTRRETREALESRVLTPLVRYLAAKFSWSVRLFQVVAVLVLIQTLILLWLLFREVKRPVVVGVSTGAVA